MNWQPPGWLKNVYARYGLAGALALVLVIIDAAVLLVVGG